MPNSHAVKRAPFWLAWIPVIVLIVGLIAAFVRVQLHAEDRTHHLTREVLIEEYVPRRELDHRMDVQTQILREIKGDVKELRREVKDLD